MALKTLISMDAGGFRRRFMAVQSAKAAIGLGLAFCFCLLAGPPDRVEALAMLGLVAPGFLALLGFTSLSLGLLEQVGLILFAGLIGLLATLTGGVASPLVVWFAL